MRVQDLIPAPAAPNNCSVPGCKNRPWLLYRCKEIRYRAEAKYYVHFCGACWFRPERNDEENSLEFVLHYYRDIEGQPVIPSAEFLEQP